MSSRSTRVVMIIGLSIALATAAGCASHSKQKEASVAAPVPVSATATEQGQMEWPIVTQTGGNVVTVYQPQLEAFAKARFRGRVALAVQIDARGEQAYGTAWMDSITMCDRTARTITLADVNVTEIRFPEASEADQKVLADSARTALAGRSIQLTWDQMLEMMKAAGISDPDEGLATAPPKIVFRKHPAVLIQYDGRPELLRVQDSSLMRVANTPYFVVLDTATKDCYLKVAGKWFQSKDPLGPFASGTRIPGDVVSLADKYGYQNPPTDQEMVAVAKEGVEILTATEPAELIYTDGEPQMGAIAGANLLYVTNTDSDVFSDELTQQKYILISGRWYTATTYNGPWTYVPADSLPEGFKMIPPGSPKGHVLASVAGTDAASTAVLDAQVPQTAMIDRTTAERPAVDYDGDPVFQPVGGTSVYYSPNTSYSVLRVGDLYYCCYNAVWYVSSSPQGPWQLCTSVPADIYTIPPSCPIYPVRYCYIYNYTPDYIYCGYTPGYTGCFIFGPTVVFGTGFWNHCWFRHRYFPRPCTFGFDAFFDPFQCQWSFRCGFGFPRAFFGRHIIEERREHWGGGGWWGFGGFHHADVHVDQSLGIDRDRFDVFTRRSDVRATAIARPLAGATGRVGITRFEGRSNVTGGMEAGRMGVTGPRQGGFETTTGERRTTERGVTERSVTDGRTGQEMRNNVLADPQGNVHRMTPEGWETRQGTRWVPTQSAPATAARGVTGPTPRNESVAPAPRSQPVAPAAPQRNMGELDREYRARVAAPQRETTWSHSSYSESRSSSASRPTESSSSSGGGGRSGGGSRGGGGGGRGR